MTTGRHQTPAPETSTGATGSPERPVHAGEPRPFKLVLVVDFKGFIHLKKQAQQGAT